MIALLLVFAATQQPTQALQLALSERQGICTAEVGGNAFRLPIDGHRLQAELHRLRRRAAELHMIPAAPEFPSYRCLGSVIRLAQKARLRIGFISEPAP